jgi:hypothetical protein
MEEALFLSLSPDLMIDQITATDFVSMSTLFQHIWLATARYAGRPQSKSITAIDA